MKRDGLRTILQLGLIFTGLSVCSILYQPRDSAEFVLSFCSLGIGVSILLIAALLILMMR
ncbi:MAG: hypothetical protein OHK0046_50090 [Anaerolineae bacterium]